MNLTGRKPTFRRAQPRDNVYRIMIWLLLIAAGVVLARRVETGEVKYLFYPTSTPTRSFQSLEAEAVTYIELGKLDCRDETRPTECAIAAYQSALLIDPANAHMLSELARIQAYSAVMLSTDQDQFDRLVQARENAHRAIEAAPESSMAHAIYAFTLDWSASNSLVPADERQAMLLEAEREAQQAIPLDETNIAALAYLAEIQLDQAKWNQAEETINSAKVRPGADELMDVHRVAGLVAETMSQYDVAIQEFQRAVEINPNLTFLYIRIGNLYRRLAGNQKLDLNPELKNALEYYGTAVSINERLGINDPNPYLVIGNTYANQGEFYAAVLNVRKALEIDPGDPKVFAQLGLVYFKSKNYEGSIEAFKCGLDGCTAEEACIVRQSGTTCDDTNGTGPAINDPMALSDSTLLYYYTYGSVLAALDRPGRPYCSDALRIMSKVRERYASDANTMSIVEAGEDICSGQ